MKSRPPAVTFLLNFFDELRRRAEELEGVPIFIVSSFCAHLPDFEIPQGGWLAHDAFLSKPVDTLHLLEKVRPWTSGALPVTGMVAATASLKSKTVVAERRKIIGDVRRDVLSFLDAHGFEYIPSVSNKFMVNVRRPGREIIDALMKEKIYVGRVWPSMPQHVRVSVGTQEEMNKFKTAFLKVMA